MTDQYCIEFYFYSLSIAFKYERNLFNFFKKKQWGFLLDTGQSLLKVVYVNHSTKLALSGSVNMAWSGAYLLKLGRLPR